MSTLDDHAAKSWPRVLEEGIALRQEMSALLPALQAALAACVRAIQLGHKVILLGNGGSAADAQHIAAEFVGRFRLERAPWPALALSENVSSITGLGNDYSYDVVFERQLVAFAKPGDVLIALSTSGASNSVVRALERADALQVTRIVITGRRGEKNAAALLSDILVEIPSRDTAAVQEGYMTFLHALCGLTEEALAS